MLLLCTYELLESPQFRGIAVRELKFCSKKLKYEDIQKFYDHS